MPKGLLEIKMVPGKSMDEIDNESFCAKSRPFDGNLKNIRLAEKRARHPSPKKSVCLCDGWMMAAEKPTAFINQWEPPEEICHWNEAVPAVIPGSVQTALVKAGKYPDPYFAINDDEIRKESYKNWYFKKEFPRPKGMRNVTLIFKGVNIKCYVWINGHELGEHEGMFGQFEFDITDYLENKTVLYVQICPAPAFFKANDARNHGWRTTVTFNNNYGWHYARIPALGIWRPVLLEEIPRVKLESPFIAAEKLDGTMNLMVNMKSETESFSGNLKVSVEPDNFKGKAFSFEEKIKSGESSLAPGFRFKIPDPKIWWPNGMGEQNLYKLKVSFTPDGGGTPDYSESIFGIRTIEMAPLPGGPKPDKLNWTFIINGKRTFVKGNGWCTPDALMDFRRERYDRFLSLAKLQHVQMMRAWGSGMPETDDFYDLCDRYGIMVMQEWPSAWESHKQGNQPYDVMEETVEQNTLRLRNHPSLVMYGTANETGNPFGKMVDMMGRLSIELDGTRPYHRSEPWGGSDHNYECYWGRKHLDYNLNMTADFWGEFGLACMPAAESVRRYLPENERESWPPQHGISKSIAHHTPKFNTADDMSRVMQYAAYFTEIFKCDLEEFTLSSQLSQAVGVRHTLELARTRWPHCTGALYYKMNDNYPAASWACADWYGVPKVGHYFFQDSFAPLKAAVLFNTINSLGKKLSLPVFLLDDNDNLSSAGWTVKVKAYNSSLDLVKCQEFTGKGSVKAPFKLGEFNLAAEQTDTTPLFIVSEVFKGKELADMNYYFVNFEEKKRSLFTLPQTSMEMKVSGKTVKITNTGKLPAVAVNVLRPGHLDTFTADDNYFWLEPGETKTVAVDNVQGLKLSAWNKK